MFLVVIVIVGVRMLILGALTGVPSSLLVVAVVLGFVPIFPPAKIPSIGYHREVTSWISLQGIDPRESLAQVFPPQACSDFLFFLSWIHYGGHFVHFLHPVLHRWQFPYAAMAQPICSSVLKRAQACSSDHINFFQRRRRDRKVSKKMKEEFVY